MLFSFLGPCFKDPLVMFAPEYVAYKLIISPGTFDYSGQIFKIKYSLFWTCLLQPPQAILCILHLSIYSVSYI